MGWYPNESGKFEWQQNEWMTLEWPLNDGMTQEWYDDIRMITQWWKDRVVDTTWISMEWQKVSEMTWMSTEKVWSKSRAFALIKKKSSFHPHSSHSTSLEGEKMVIPTASHSFLAHSVLECPSNDQKVILKWLKMTGMDQGWGW